MASLMLHGRPVVAGLAVGRALVSHEALSFWGGYDWKTGEIIDPHHDLAGANAKGRVLAIPFSRGSSTTTAVLLEAIRAGTAPVAILTAEVDFFFALGSVVADEMYDASLPIVALSAADFARLQTGDQISIEDDGGVVLAR